MSTKATIFLTEDNEHCYEEVIDDTIIMEFSKDNKPVIIDQPEDSLDNRAIYNDLTNYLKQKKKERQTK